MGNFTGNLIVNNTNYSGEVVEKLLVRATTGCEIVDGGYVHIRVGVKSKLSLPRLRTKGYMLQRRKEMPKSGAGGDSKGEFHYDEKYLEPQDMMVYVEFNPAQFEHIWRPFQPTGEMVFQELPIETQEALLLELSKQVQSELGDLYLNCIKGAGERDFFEGLIIRMKNDNELTPIAGAHKITDETILPAMKKVRTSIPKAKRKSKLMTYFMSQEDFDIYDDVLTNKPFKHEDYTNMNKNRYKGYPIAVLADLPKDVIFAAEASTDTDSNLWIGVNLSEDATAIKVGQVQNSGELYFFKMLMKADTNTVFGEDIAFWDGRDVEPPAVEPANAPITPAALRVGAPAPLAINISADEITKDIEQQLADKKKELEDKERELEQREKALQVKESTSIEKVEADNAKLTKAAIKGLNRKGLEAIIEENKFNIEVKVGMTNDQLSDLIIEALGEAYFAEKSATE